MVTISDIVGALLRGVTAARVQADIYSSQASQEYLKDPTLRSYPVPRTDIRSADINLRLALVGAVATNIDNYSVTLAAITPSVPGYADKLMGLPAKGAPGLPDDAAKPLGDLLGDKAAKVKSSTEAKLKDYLGQNINAVHDALSQDAKNFGATTWTDVTIVTLKDAVGAQQVYVDFDDPLLSSSLQKAAITWSEAAFTASQMAKANAQADGFDLDLSVKKDDLYQLPDHIMSEIKLSLAVDNYEWTTSKDSQGNTVNKLTIK